MITLLIKILWINRENEWKRFYENKKFYCSRNEIRKAKRDSTNTLSRPSSQHSKGKMP